MRASGQENSKAVNENDVTIGRLASIGQIAAGIAHEVRNPLTAVKGFLQLLQGESPHAYLDIACSELERAIDTLQDLLQVSKPDLDDEPYTSIHLCTELESILYLFQDQIYRVQVEKDLRNHDEVIYGKRNQLKKVFFNLLKNAFEAIPGKGKIEVQHYREDKAIIVQISDTGVGIPEDKLQLLGTPFFTTKDDGTGMGLTQVFSTIYQHGAKIEVQSTKGVGTTFTIAFAIREKKEIGVIHLNLTYTEGQNFKEFFAKNRDRFEERLRLEAQSTYDLVENSNLLKPGHLDYAAQKLTHCLIEGIEHELIALAQEHSKEWAKDDLPLVAKLEWIQSFRKVYWDFLYNYHLNVQIDQEGFFRLERVTNDMMDLFAHHYFTSFTEYKNDLIRSHREMIDDLTVPVIPLSSSMAVLPIVGTMDTYRAKRIQERILTQITALKMERIIIDLSGVAYMDTAVVGHLFRIVEGIALLGCKAVITGIRPEIANTIIEMGIVITDKVTTMGNLQQALKTYGVS